MFREGHLIPSLVAFLFPFTHRNRASLGPTALHWPSSGLAIPSICGNLLIALARRRTPPVRAARTQKRTSPTCLIVRRLQRRSLRSICGCTLSRRRNSWHDTLLSLIFLLLFLHLLLSLLLSHLFSFLSTSPLPSSLIYPCLLALPRGPHRVTTTTTTTDRRMDGHVLL